MWLRLFPPVSTLPAASYNTIWPYGLAEFVSGSHGGAAARAGAAITSRSPATIARATPTPRADLRLRVISVLSLVKRASERDGVIRIDLIQAALAQGRVGEPFALSFAHPARAVGAHCARC